MTTNTATDTNTQPTQDVRQICNRCTVNVRYALAHPERRVVNVQHVRGWWFAFCPERHVHLAITPSGACITKPAATIEAATGMSADYLASADHAAQHFQELLAAAGLAAPAPPQ
jgi:hypothetical protein